MKIGFVQFTPVFGDKDRNLKKVEALIQGADADLLVLPELFDTGYLFEDRQELVSLAEEPQGRTGQALKDVAAAKGCHVVAGFAELSGDKVYNSAMLVGPGGIEGVYRKSHLFDREKELFEPGDTGFTVFDVNGVGVGIMICFDWYFPESARTLALKGADIIAHPANLVLPFCQSAMPIRCLENKVFSITANRAGTESRASSKLSFTGRSIIASPSAQVLAEGPPRGDCVGVVEVDPLLARNKHATPNNHVFQDRRTELYELY